MDSAILVHRHPRLEFLEHHPIMTSRCRPQTRGGGGGGGGGSTFNATSRSSLVSRGSPSCGPRHDAPNCVRLRRARPDEIAKPYLGLPYSWLSSRPAIHENERFNAHHARHGASIRSRSLSVPRSSRRGSGAGRASASRVGAGWRQRERPLPRRRPGMARGASCPRGLRRRRQHGWPGGRGVRLGPLASGHRPDLERRRLGPPVPRRRAVSAQAVPAEGRPRAVPPFVWSSACATA